MTLICPASDHKRWLVRSVIMYNIGNARYVSGPRNAQLEFTLMYWAYFPMPKPIQIAVDGYEAIMSWKSPINMTRTSLLPLFGQKPVCILCRERVELVQQFLCRLPVMTVASLHIARAPACDNRFVWSNVYFLVLGKLEVWNSPFQVFVLSCRKAFQFGGILVSPVTFFLWPLPLFSLVESLILFALYISQTMSTRGSTWLEMIQNEWDEDVFSIAIKINVETVVDGVWTTAAPSKILQS